MEKKMQVFGSGSINGPTFTMDSAPGMIKPGNIDVTKIQPVKNPDGTYSTVRSISIESDGREVLIPTVVNGRVVSDKEAIDHYMQTGQNLGMFLSAAAADAFAQWLHEQEAKRIGK